MFTYCLYCESGSCDVLARIVEITQGCQVINPKQIQHQRRRGRERDVIRDLMPGYLFLYFEQDPFPTVLKAQRLPGVFHFMGTKEDLYVLKKEDERFALMLLERDGVLGKLRVVEEEDGMFRLADPEGKMKNVEILKADRRKHRMKIQISIAYHPVTTWVEFEIEGQDGEMTPRSESEPIVEMEPENLDIDTDLDLILDPDFELALLEPMTEE